MIAPLLLLPVIGQAAAGNSLQPIMGQLLADGAPGVIVLSRDGDKQTITVAGNGDLSPPIPLASTDRVRAGSLVKSFVAVLTLQLAGEGSLGLDDGVEAHLPGIVPNGASITIRQLLNHTSGIFDYWQDESFFKLLLEDPTLTWAPETLVQLAIAHPPVSEPGGAWSYSNTNYILLGQVIEAVTGNTLAAELETRIFSPLELDGTSFDSSPDIAGAHAHGYALLGEPVPSDVTAVSPSAAWTAGGGLVSTAIDIATFYAALLHGDLLPSDQMAQMLTTVPAGEGLDYGLGIAEVAVPCGTAWGHRGEFPGYLSMALTSRDGERQAVVLVNFYSLTEAGHAAFDNAVAAAFCE